jgi:hypothetical protein
MLEQCPLTCPRCGGELIELECSAGPHYAELRCPACDKHVKFLPAPWTRQRAESFRVPFGAYAGTSLAELAETETGRKYLAWMATHLRGNPGIAARIVLKQTRDVVHEIN